MRRLLVVAVLLVVSLVAVAVLLVRSRPGTSPVVEGLVVDVQGDLVTVRTFTILDEEGRRWTFRPAPGVTLHGGPLGHLKAHMAAGEPVRVRYRSGSGGDLVAVAVEDG